MPKPVGIAWLIIVFAGWGMSVADPGDFSRLQAAFNPPPPAQLSTRIVASTMTPHTNATLTFTTNTTGGVGPYSVYWSFGDNSAEVGFTTSHIFKHAGNYYVIATALDSETHEQTARAYLQQTVTDPPKSAAM